MSDINVTVQDEIVNIDVIDTPVIVEVTNSPGQQGPAGVGVPVGGSTGQVLAKTSATNYATAWVNPSGGGVPYTGATGNVNLGEYELKAGQVTLDTTPTGIAAVGTTRWNDTIGSSETTLKGGSVVLKNGVDLVARVVNKVSPNTTLTKAAYQAVRISGAQGQRLAVALAQANNDTNSADTIGLVTETIATNQEGFIMTMGQLENINTTGSLQGETWVDGDVLYLSPFTAGAITNIKPTGAGHIVVIGYVEYAHQNNGKIYVKVMNGWELEELHDVDIVSPANNEALIYESSTSLWKNKTIATALGFTPANAATTLTINGVTYDLSANRSWTIAAGIIGSGAAGQVTYWTGASAVSGSNNLFWDNTNGRLNIGTTLPTTIATHNIFGTSTFVGVSIKNNSTASGQTQACIALESSTSSVASLFKTGSNYTTYKIITANDLGFYNSSAGDISILNDLTTGRIKFASGGVSTSQMTLFANGNLAINSGVSDLGVRLGVVGDTLLRGSGATSATTALTVQNSSSTNLFTIDNAGNVNSSLGYSFGAGGTISASAGGHRNIRFGAGATNLLGAYGAGISNSIYLFSYATSNNTDANTNSLWGITHTFNPTSGSSGYIMMGLQPTINQTGGANGITRGLYVNPTLTAAADFRAIETTAGNVLFGSNFFWDNANSRLGIGTNAPTATLTVAGGLTLSSGSLSLPVAIHSIFAGAYRIWNRASNRWTFEANNANIGFEFKHIMTSGNAFHIVNTSDTSQFLVSGGGNTILGSSTDAGQRLQVYGDTLLRGSGATSATTALTVQNSAGTQLMRIYNVYQSGAYIGAEFGDGTLVGTNYFNILNGGAASIQTRFIDVNASDAMLSLNGGSGVGNTSFTQTRGSVLLGNQNYALTGATTNNVVVCVTGSFVPTSGSAGFVDLFIRPTINQTGGANGITRGLYVNPTLTSAADFRAIETARGNIVFGNLPTSSAGLPSGALWNNGGVINIV